jgi:exonuclease VII large subunit
MASERHASEDAMERDVMQTQGEPQKGRSVNVWMFVAIGAIVVSLIMGYLAWSYKQQVDEWQAAADETVAKLEAAGVELRSTVETGVDGYEQQISELTTALEEAETQGGISEAQLEETEQELADTQAQLESKTSKLQSTKQELAETEAELADANATLAQLGEIVLSDGNYVGPVLGARVDPFPAIVFQDGTLWRVGEVSSGVAIKVSGESLTIDELAVFLQSTTPEVAALANGDWEVKVAEGLVTKIKSVAA